MSANEKVKSILTSIPKRHRTNEQLDIVRRRLRELQVEEQILLEHTGLQEKLADVTSEYKHVIQAIVEQVKAGSPELEEAMIVLKQTQSEYQKILDLLVDIRFFCERQTENNELEKQVLTKINTELGK